MNETNRFFRAQATRLGLLAALLAAAAGCAPASAPVSAPVTTSAQIHAYVPAPGTAWERRRPAEAGMDSARLAEAVAFAVANETRWPRDIRAAMVQSGLAAGPYGEIIGPIRDRGAPAGIILRGGRIVAEWGDTERPDITFSVAKSYLATVAGVALDRGLIRDLDEPVARSVSDGGFTGRNAPITWRMLLQQTSEWEGTLWDKPDVADRRAGRDRALNAPGTFWEYNDVRVNRTALALLRLFEKPLPEVLRDEVMAPIGASDGWEWRGYRNSVVEIGGRPMESVSGGSHWGGGMFISTRDHARFGLLHLRRGRWGDRQILPQRWIREATTPTDIKPTYGFLWWLNTDRALYPSAPASSFFALGAGTNLIWVDPEHDLVAVVRWIENRETDGFVARVLAALEPIPTALRPPSLGRSAFVPRLPRR